MSSTDLTSKLLQLLDRWSAEANLHAFVFGSVLADPMSFDPTHSDVDLVVVLPSAIAGASDRVRFLAKLRSRIQVLETEVLTVLRRNDAAEPCCSVVCLTEAELHRGIHKSGLLDFFSANTFRPLGLNPSPARRLADRPAQEANEILAGIQKARNVYLRCSPNHAVTAPSYDGAEPLPKDLARFAALRDGSAAGTKEFSVHTGLGNCLALLNAAAEHDQMARSVQEVVLRRCNQGRGSVPPIAPDMLMYLWELVGSSANDGDLQHVSSGKGLPSADHNIMRLFADALVTASPSALISTAATCFTPTSIGQLLRPVVEACWRVHDATQVLHWASDLHTDAADGLLDDDTAAILRLVAWAHWSLGQPSKASQIYAQHYHRVVTIGERARWADQQATIHRFSASEDWGTAESQYHHALSLRPSSDLLGIGITLQNLAFLYLENSELENAYRFMRRTQAHAIAHEYDGSTFAALVGLLGMAWIDLMIGGPSRLGRAAEHLRSTGALIRSERRDRIPAELRETARAMVALRAIRVGYERSFRRRVSEFFWPSLIAGQVEVLNATPVQNVVKRLRERFPLPKLAPHRLTAVLEMVGQAPDARPPSPIENPAELPWPLSALVGRADGSVLGVIQAFEALLSLYQLILIGSKAGAGARGIRMSKRRIQQLRALAREHDELPVAREALIVASIAESVSHARNQTVHSMGSLESETALRQAFSLALDEARLLRVLQWERGHPPSLCVGADIVELGAACRLDDRGRIVLELGGAELVEGADFGDPGD